MGKAKNSDQVATNPPEDHSGLTGLWVSDAQTTEPGVLWAGLDRAELRRQHAAGELSELEFDACVFRAVYPNWNYVRFREEDLHAFAASFVGAPFLRNHDMQNIAARDGIVTACCMNGDGMYARIKLTTEEGIRDFLAGRIDRFSISWFKRGSRSAASAAATGWAPSVSMCPGVRFIPTQLGITTSGTFTTVLDGSDVGLDSYSENIDAIGRTANGNLFISTSGNPSVPGLTGTPSDLLVFTATSLGDTTSGSWAMYFDGSDVGLGDSIYTAIYENVRGAWLDLASGNLYLTTAGEFTTQAGFGGDLNDIFVCTAAVLGDATSCSFVFYWDGAQHGLAGKNIDGVGLGSVIAPPPAPLATPTMITDAVIYLNSLGGTGSGLLFDGNDIVTHNTATGAWAMYFDGSDVGIIYGVDAFAQEDDGSLLLSIGLDGNLPGLGTADNADIIRFTPTTLGVNMSGTYTVVLDGSDVGLDSENIDAISRTPDGRLLVSVAGSFNAGGVTGANEDLFVFDATQLGATTSGSWAMYFDGSDIGLDTGTNEDIDGAWVDPATGNIYLGNYGDFGTGGGFGGDGNDIFACAPASLGEDTACNLGLYWDGRIHGISGGNLRDFVLAPAAGIGGAQAITCPAEQYTEVEGMRDNSIHLPFVAAP